MNYRAPKLLLTVMRDPHTEEAPIISKPGMARDLFADMAYLDREHIRVALLNVKNRLIGVETVAIGYLCGSVACPREVFKSAIISNAYGVILAHNHPSGDPSPSSDDDRMTQRMAEAGRLLGVEVLDHVIIGANGQSYSYREAGKLKP